MYETAVQIRAKHIEAMGPALGPVYNVLTNDVTWLHVKWSQYRQLFDGPQEQIDLLNATAGYFFYVIQRTLIDDVLLHLARLADRAETFPGKSNLTLRTLPQMIAAPRLADEVSRLVDVACEKCKSAQDRRNRQLAHHDLHVALATAKVPLPDIRRADIEAALSAIRAALNRLQTAYWQSEVGYQYFAGGPADAASLCFFLQRGFKTEEAKLARLREGRFLPEDLKSDSQQP